jgi:hypothetical protein
LAVVMHGKRKVSERREGLRHWIARYGCVIPSGYRGSIGLVGGLRLSISDPRMSCLSGGRGAKTPISRSVDSDEPKTQGPGAERPRAPRYVEV